MDKFMGKYSPQAYALLRMVTGFLFLAHGLQKIFGMLHSSKIGDETVHHWFGGQPAEAFSQMWVGGAIELVGGVLILVGFQSAWAAFICSGMMAVAYFQMHQPQGLLPAQNGGEKAALYAFVFLFIAARGSGIWSVDALLGKKGDD